MTALTIAIYAATLLIWMAALCIATRTNKRQRAEIHDLTEQNHSQRAKIADLLKEVLQARTENIGSHEEYLNYEIANYIGNAEYKAEGDKVWRIATIKDDNSSVCIYTLIKVFDDPDPEYNRREAEDLANHLNEK